MSKTNDYCRALGIEVPRLEVAKYSHDANYYSLLIVALLERGEPVTLQEAAMRMEEAGVAPVHQALQSLRRCKPGRPPIYRDGDLYALDTHDHETDLWVFRLDLRPPAIRASRMVHPVPGSLPVPNEPLTVANLDEAWRQGVPSGWSAQRTAICVLDAHGSGMSPGDVVAFVKTRSRWSRLSADSVKFWYRDDAIQVSAEGLWTLDPEHNAVRSAREAVRERIAIIRRWTHTRPDPVVVEANRMRLDREREAVGERLAGTRRVLVHAFPVARPEAIVLLDVGRHEIASFVGDEIAAAKDRLNVYDVIAATNVRALLRSLDLDQGERHLEELGPPQKTKQLNKRGRTLKITTCLLVQGTCGISHPFGNEEVLRGYLRTGEVGKLRRRLESDAKSLYALYQYGRLHGAVRLRWGFLDEMIPAPWVHRDEPSLYHLMKRAHAVGRPLEIVIGNAPGWADPWSRVRRVLVRKEEAGGPHSWLVDEEGFGINPDEVQAARLAQSDEGEPDAGEPNKGDA